MISKKENFDPKKLITVGMLFLALSIAWPRIIHVTGTLSTDAIDAIKGVLFGVALGLLILAARLGGFRKDLR